MRKFAGTAIYIYDRLNSSTDTCNFIYQHVVIGRIRRIEKYNELNLIILFLFL